MRYSLISAMLLFLSISSHAQEKLYSEKDYISKPVWISMMNDTLANYFEVEKAYTLYWQHHQMPVSEDEFEGKREKDKQGKNEDEKMTLAEAREKNQMAEAIKAYKVWHMQMLPFVQDDGRILTPTEQIAAWRYQQDQLKQQTKK